MERCGTSSDLDSLLFTRRAPRHIEFQSGCFIEAGLIKAILNARLVSLIVCEVCAAVHTKELLFQGIFNSRSIEKLSLNIYHIRLPVFKLVIRTPVSLVLKELRLSYIMMEPRFL